jgi:hypothetical protein
MSSFDVEDKISSFLQRKDEEFPELAFSGRNESTFKKAAELRAHGQVLMTR